MYGTLYLIPTTIGSNNLKDTLPGATTAVILRLNEFIVENIRTARRAIKNAGYNKSLDDITFHVLDKHTTDTELPAFLESIKAGQSVGLLSESGCPCIADPGAKIVRLAHKYGITVKPLTGPSSIFLAIMASGFNGQNFAFHGYLPIDKKQQQRRLKILEKQAIQQKQTQVFMEAPFRNNKLFINIMEALSPSTLLCIASELTTSDEYVETKSISDWKKHPPELNKKNTVFLVYH